MSNIDISEFRVGIVGAGLMGLWHAKYAKRLGVKLVAILDSDITSAEKLAKQITSGSTACTAYIDIDDMLKNANLDVVHICTPVSSHFSITKKSLEANANVFVEKPLAMTVAETETLLSVANERNLIICPVHQFGFQNGVLKAKKSLESLGELYSLRFTVASAGGEGQVAMTLDEIIADVIPHPLSVLQRLKPGINLNVENWSSVHGQEGELHIIGEADSVAIDIYVSMNARPTRCEMDLFCSKGKVSLNLFHGYSVIETGDVSRLQKIIQPITRSLNEFYIASLNLLKRTLNKEPAYPGLTRLLSDFYEAVVTKKLSPIPPADVLAVAIARDNIALRLEKNGEQFK